MLITIWNSPPLQPLTLQAPRSLLFSFQATTEGRLCFPQENDCYLDSQVNSPSALYVS